jgi:hypothetical protein
MNFFSSYKSRFHAKEYVDVKIYLFYNENNCTGIEKKMCTLIFH